MDRASKYIEVKTDIYKLSGLSLSLSPLLSSPSPPLTLGSHFPSLLHNYNNLPTSPSQNIVCSIVIDLDIFYQPLHYFKSVLAGMVRIENKYINTCTHTQSHEPCSNWKN